MATVEERLTHLEKENQELKEKIDLLTVSVGALVSKSTLESLKEQNGKLFDALLTHDKITN